MSRPFESRKPWNLEVVSQFDFHSLKQIENRLSQTESAYQNWKTTSLHHRSEAALRLERLLIENKETLARLITEEMGKPIRQSHSEIEKCALLCHYFASSASEFLADKEIETSYKRSALIYNPLGVIFGIMPWNFPFWQVFRFAVPALMAGNACLLKHAPNTPRSALAIEDLFQKAEFPTYLFQNLFVREEDCEAVIQDSRIKALSFTGSEGAGRALSQIAGRYLKKTVMELGGSDPYLILEDADLKLAAQKCIESRFLNAGQSCIAAKRWIIPTNKADEFIALVSDLLKSYKMTPPLEEECLLGPMAREDLRNKLDSQVKASLKMGAHSILGCSIPNLPGAFYPASLITNVKKGMPAYDEEIFGPVACIITARHEKEAVEIANDTPYGLGAAIFSKDTERAQKIGAQLIEAGNVFINDFVKSDPRLPFGGIKNSGHGRELSSVGIHEFCNLKTLVVND